MSAEPDDEPTGTRRGFMSGLAGGGIAGLLMSAASAEANTGVQSVSASLGEVAPGVYKWAEPAGYAGSNSARSNITPETGAVFFGWDSGDERLFRGDGSSWVEIANLSNIGTGGTGGSTVVSGSPTLVEAADSPYSLTAGEMVQVNTAGGNVELDLPGSPSQGDAVGIQIINSSNDTTLDPQTNSIESRYATLTQLGYVEPKFTNGSTWRVGPENYQDFSNRPITDPSGKVITASDAIATESQLGGSVSDRGKVTAYSSDPQHSFSPRDPDNFASLDAAVRDLVTDVESTTSDATFIEIPHNSSAGAQLTWDAQVEFGASGNTVPTFKGAVGRQTDYILSNITNGDPMMLVRTKMTGINYGMVGPLVDGQANDCECFRFLQASGGTLVGGNYRRFAGGSATGHVGVIVVDSETSNMLITRPQFNGNGAGGQQENVSDMRCIAIDDSLGGGSPGTEPHIHGLGSYSDPAIPMDSIIWTNVAAGNCKITNSRFEGAGGTASVYFGGGSPIIGGGNEFGRTENSCNAINAEGDKFAIGNIKGSATIDGHGVYIAPGVGVVGDVTLNCNGDDVVVTGNPGAGQVTVPNPSSLQGTANYPSGASNVWVRQVANPP